VRLLLIGVGGQVGGELQGRLPALGEVTACDFPAIDLADAQSVRATLASARPDVIVNAAAYTAVDRAESELERAMLVNGAGPGVLAEEARRIGSLLVHYSTDYVFDGVKPSPYVESDAPNPLNAYGASKLEGERRIAASGCRHLILRTSWVYGASGQNFLLTVLRLARQGKALRVVDDQHGAPTSSSMLAAATIAGIRALLRDDSLSGLYHASAGGETTWYRFAQAIFQATGTAAQLTAIPSREYPTPARRPCNSVLDNGKLATMLKLRLPSWQEGLAEVLQALR
jgi:dTDP-4-dehydrorhamnose reductase